MDCGLGRHVWMDGPLDVSSTLFPLPGVIVAVCGLHHNQQILLGREREVCRVVRSIRIHNEGRRMIRRSRRVVGCLVGSNHRLVLGDTAIIIIIIIIIILSLSLSLSFVCFSPKGKPLLSSKYSSRAVHARID